MGYKNATCILPDELVRTIQTYIDGDYLYIPRKEENKKAWGEMSKSKQLLQQRNATIFAEYQSGTPVEELAQRFFLSPKTIYKILSKFQR